MSQQAASEAELCPWCWNRRDSGEMFQRSATKTIGFQLKKKKGTSLSETGIIPLNKEKISRLY